MSDKTAPTEFLNGVIQGLTEMAYNWEGSAYGIMGSLVGAAIVEDIALPQVKEAQKGRDALVDELSNILEKELTSRFGVASKIKLTRSEKQGLTLEADDCVLIPMEDYLANKGMQSRCLFCPVVNIVVESLYKIGIDSEIRSWEIATKVNPHCHHVIGLMEDVPAVTEIKAGKSC
jgi:hypothetical protein